MKTIDLVEEPALLDRDYIHIKDWNDFEWLATSLNILAILRLGKMYYLILDKVVYMYTMKSEGGTDGTSKV